MSFPAPRSLGCAAADFAASVPDDRADGGVRHIRMSARGVRIERQVAGIKMHLAVPIHGYEGVVLTCNDEVDRRLYKIALVHHDPDLTVELHQAPESPAVLTIWRNWADFFAKPALYRETTSAGLRPLPGVARSRPRRRGQPLIQRRPRFRKRRCGGCFDSLGAVLRAIMALD
jgi:hypothetical protein